MRGTQLRLRHLVGAATLSFSVVLAYLSLASVPAGAQTVAASTSCPVLSVGNPNPGDTIGEGGYVISGEAFDPAATSGSGISRVDLFLGERDSGGLFLGSTVPGATSSNPRAFTVEVTIPGNLNEGVDFAAYAISSVTGQQTAVVFPIFVGTTTRNNGDPTPTPIPTTETITNTCPTEASAAAPAAPAVSGTPAAAAPAAPAAPATGTGAGNGCPTLSVANPSPADHLSTGALNISGSAMVLGSTSGSGVSRVDLFLGQRDLGGQFLGTAVPGEAPGGNAAAWNVTVTIPDLGRGVDFAAYAIGTNGQESSVVFPVFVGAEPTRTSSSATPTPIPGTITFNSTCAHA